MEYLPKFAFLFVILGFMAVEAIWRMTAKGRGYDFAASGGALGVMVGGFFTKALGAAVIAVVYTFFDANSLFSFSMTNPWVWAAGFVVMEFQYYWMHRFAHTVRWMWCDHSVHHTANQYAFPAAIRLGWLTLFGATWLFYMPAIVLGFPAEMIVILLVANLRFQFFLHTEAVGRLGPVEWIMNTPSHHRVHHASNPACLDKNFGGVTIVFDRLFGTFHDEREEAGLTYGLTKPLTSANPFVIALREWSWMVRDVVRARSLSDLARATFGRPSDLAAIEAGGRDAGAPVPVQREAALSTV